MLREKPPPILITNPDMLHFSFLGHADQWQQFLRNLKWVIIDEIHEYRGYFGSDVAMILSVALRVSFYPECLGYSQQNPPSDAAVDPEPRHTANQHRRRAGLHRIEPPLFCQGEMAS